MNLPEGWLQIGGQEIALTSLHQNALHSAAPLRQGCHHDVQGLVDHGVGSRNINEKITGLLSDARQIAVYDGREGEHLIQRIYDEGITLAALQDMTIIFAFGVLMQHLLHGHLLGEVQGHELT